MAKKIIGKNWEHGANEEGVYLEWEKKGYFKPKGSLGSADLARDDRKDGGNDTLLSSPTRSGIHDLDSRFHGNDRKEGAKPPFVISMPPPNVTGKLHIGHALFVTIEDIMIRYHRMLGEETLWLPGTDHAGIATQAVVTRELKKRGIDRQKIGRKKFIEEVLRWKEKHGGEITKQLRRMGASCDWSRERFTLDEGLSNAVSEAFVTLYKKGLIYRGEYIVNWCAKCGTAIADDEVAHQDQIAKLYYFKYDKDFPITIATTRPETKLGDVAVTVNPKDARYKKYHNQEIKINLDGVKRSIRVIVDSSVDIKFGSGAVGLTPAHSAIDWRIAENHKLPKIKVIDERGKICNAGEKYDGLRVMEAREKIVAYLKSNQLLLKEEEIENCLSVCYRCGTAIEPMPSKQWFLKMGEMAKKAKAVVKSGEIEIIPKRFEKVYFHWLDNIRDWCISRQLWWGHRIPVWYKRDAITNNQDTITKQITNHKSQITNEIYVGTEAPKDIENWAQDEDVLDTWFSSALWPFSTLGYPDIQSSDYQRYYPTTVMETGYDILFFWVAKMIMMGLELTGKAPFKTVYLHGLVRDEQNRKMSKSLGNNIDPLEVIDKFGTDAVRMSLVVGTSAGADSKIGEAKIKGYRNFLNKIWNASRFVILSVCEGNLKTGEMGESKINDINIDQTLLTNADKSILKRHSEIIEEVTEKLNKYQFSQAGELLYEYFWHEFCDEYIEVAKTQLEAITNNQDTRNKQIKISNLKSQNDNAKSKIISENTKKILVMILGETLQMMHPFVPFVTEVAWQNLDEVYARDEKSIMISKWPSTKKDTITKKQ